MEKLTLPSTQGYIVQRFVNQGYDASDVVRVVQSITGSAYVRAKITQTMYNRIVVALADLYS